MNGYSSLVIAGAGASGQALEPRLQRDKFELHSLHSTNQEYSHRAPQLPLSTAIDTSAAAESTEHSGLKVAQHPLVTIEVTQLAGDNRLHEPPIWADWID